MLRFNTRSYNKLEKSPSDQAETSTTAKPTARPTLTRSFAMGGLPPRESSGQSAHAGSTPPRRRPEEQLHLPRANDQPRPAAHERKVMFNERAQVFDSVNSKTVIFEAKGRPQRNKKTSDDGTSALRRPSVEPQSQPSLHRQPEAVAPESPRGLMSRLFHKSPKQAEAAQAVPQQSFEASMAETRRREQNEAPQKFQKNMGLLMKSDLDKSSKQNLERLYLAGDIKQFKKALSAAMATLNQETFDILQAMQRALASAKEEDILKGRPVQAAPQQRVEISPAELKEREQEEAGNKFKKRLNQLMDSNLDEPSKRKLLDLYLNGKLDQFKSALGEVSSKSADKTVFALAQSIARAMSKANEQDLLDFNVHVPFKRTPTQAAPQQRVEVSAAELNRGQQHQSPAQKLNGRLNQLMTSNLDLGTKRALGALLHGMNFEGFQRALADANNATTDKQVVKVLQSVASAFRQMNADDYGQIEVRIPRK